MNILPPITPCPPPATRNETCAAQAKARWVSDNAVAEQNWADAEAASDASQNADFQRLFGMEKPEGWTDIRWSRLKMRVRQGIGGRDSARRRDALDQRDLEYLDANEAYANDMALCCEGNA